MVTMVSRTSKLILINAVKHSESHNRRKEEEEMWLTRKEEKRRRYSDSDESECHSTMLGPWPGHSKQDNLRSRGERAPPTSNKWAAALMAYEESLGDERWGHGGFKELYPEEFANTEPTADTSSSGSSSKKSKKSKDRHNMDKKSHTNSDSTPECHTQWPRKRKYEEWEQSSDSSIHESSKHKKSKKSKKSKHKKVKKSKKSKK